MANEFTHGGVVTVAIMVLMDLVGGISTMLRFTTKLQTHDGTHKDDILVLLGWIFSLSMSVNLGLEIHWAFRLGNDTTKSQFAEDFRSFLIVNYTVEPFYKLSIGFTKAAIIFLYLRLFGPLKWMRTWCNITLGFVIFWTFSCVIIGLFQCWPVHKAWDLLIPGGCVDISIFFIIQRATNLLTDVVLLALPIKVVLGLHASLAKRLALTFGFCMGGLVCIATAYTLALTISIIGREVSYSDYRSLLWTVIELEMGVFCANMPTCYALLTRCGPARVKKSVADRVESFTHNRPGLPNSSQSPRRGPRSWLKQVSANKQVYEMEDRGSTNSDAEILHRPGKIYVRHDYNVDVNNEGGSATAKRTAW